jgi:hypothetical protein
VISTYAGGAPPLAAGTSSTSIGAPISVATGEEGKVYFASTQAAPSSTRHRGRHCHEAGRRSRPRTLRVNEFLCCSEEK